MSTFVIECDAQGQLESQYPIHLQGLVTPQEFNYVIQGANSFLHKRRKLTIHFVIFHFVFMFLVMVFTLCVVWGSVYSGIVPLIVIFPSIVLLAYLSIIIGSIIWLRNKLRRVLEELRNFIETNNQQYFLSRGVQFLIKTRVVHGYNSRVEHVYMEVLVSPNASGSGGMQPLVQQKPVIQQQPLNYQSNMGMGKSYSQKVQPQYYQQ